jgi:pimeloyl-ACP methyl ester carboxylesterase
VFYVDALAPLGYRVILAEYPEYGGRKGKPKEEVLVSDAQETVRLAAAKYNGPFFVLGESLGCGVAAAAAAKGSLVRIDGMILITPWDTLLSVAKEHFPWLPARLFLRDEYDSIGNLKAYQGRIAVIGAEQDKTIPLRHAQALFASFPGEKKMWTIRGQITRLAGQGGPGAGGRLRHMEGKSHKKWRSAFAVDQADFLKSASQEAPTVRHLRHPNLLRPLLITDHAIVQVSATQTGEHSETIGRAIYAPKTSCFP